MGATFFEKNAEGEPVKLLNGLFISDAKHKNYKGTQSWSSNIVLKIHFLLKGSKIEEAQGSPKELSEAIQKIDEI